MLKSLIIGFGRAGKDLHLPCLRKVQQSCAADAIFGGVVGVVDPKINGEILCGDGSILGFHSLTEVHGFDPRTTVVHVCTPPADHVVIINKIAQLGYTKIIVEKPLALSTRGVAEVQRLQDLFHLDVFIVANWLTSVLTNQLKELLDSNRFGALRCLKIEQHKPRFARTLLDRGHATAFDVEFPHEVALALYLGGVPIQVVDAMCTDVQIGTAVFKHMGTVQAILLHNSGLRSCLASDLTAENRKRSITLYFDSYTVEGHFPTTGDMGWSRLTVLDSEQRVLESAVLADDPLTMCFQDYYRYYMWGGHKPVSDVNFNAAVISVISEAKVLSGTPLHADHM